MFPRGVSSRIKLSERQFAPHLPDGRSWDDAREEAADTIIATVDAQAPGFARSVIARQIHSPLDLERTFGLIDGDIIPDWLAD